ncbi:hypothetical protein VKT23_018605 [Stygiomarasmius scandens]|uniref:SPRY domain-containing protein n=1 Tax=Marasmiellus scandens TaxID=2682957 RepID=A0ABR1IQY3_9AGAR
MPWFSKKHHDDASSSKSSSSNWTGFYPRYPDDAPPEWTISEQKSYRWGRYNEAPEEEYAAAEAFCAQYPVFDPIVVPSHAIDRIKEDGGKAWGIELPTPYDMQRFSGRIENVSSGSKKSVVHVETDKKCKDFCLMSNLPIMAGLYDTSGRTGVYYEVVIKKMHPPKSFLAIGTACRPYPNYRLPGWNRHSAGLHLDDLRKFFEDPDGGRDYKVPFDRVRNGDIIGCGYIFASGTLFYTWNGLRLPDAFSGIHLPRHSTDVFAAIGVEGETEFDVNFGGDLFKWQEGNEWQWKVDGLAGRFSDGTGGYDEELPAYTRTAIQV